MRRGAALVATVLGGGALSACAYDAHPELVAHKQQLLPTEQYGIKVTSQPEQIALGLHAAGLSTTQQAALAQFVAQWREDGGDRVTLRTPSDSAAPAVALRMQEEAMAYLVRLGVPAEKVQVAGYVSNHAADAPLLASYERFEALAPNCSGGWKDIMTTGANIPYDHFGCAVTANNAVQVANPRDFLAPAVAAPGDDGRREVVLGKYRKGETTATAKDDQADGKVSQTSQ